MTDDPGPLAGVAAHVVTVSDRSAAGEREDRSGPLAAELLEAAGAEVTASLVPDGAAEVTEVLTAAIAAGARLVVTTGGTGVGPRDRTPEGTSPVLDRELPGVAAAIREKGVEVTPFAVLSRGLVGVVDAGERGPGALVANLPGSTGGVRDGLAVLVPLAPHVLDQLTGGDH